MADIQSAWGIEIGQAGLKALRLRYAESAGQVVAAAFDYVAHPKILSQPDADPGRADPRGAGDVPVAQRARVDLVAIAVPGQAGLVKFIKLPPVEKKRSPRHRQVRGQAADPVRARRGRLGLPADRRRRGGRATSFTMAEVGLFAMKRDQINRAILPFTVAGIEVDIVQMAPIALYNFIAFDQLRTRAGGRDRRTRSSCSTSAPTTPT